MEKNQHLETFTNHGQMEKSSPQDLMMKSSSQMQEAEKFLTQILSGLLTSQSMNEAEL